MILDWTDIEVYAGKNDRQRKIREGKRVYGSGHIIKCGKLNNRNSDNLKIEAQCVQSSHWRENPFTIQGEIQKDGKVVKCICSCTAGSGKKCKHIIGTLYHCLFLEEKDLDDISCTDTACSWRKVPKNFGSMYIPTPIDEHQKVHLDVNIPRNANLKKKQKKTEKQNLSNENCVTQAKVLRDIAHNLANTLNKRAAPVREDSKKCDDDSPIATKKAKPTVNITDSKSATITKIFEGLTKSMMMKSKARRHPAVTIQEFSKVSQREKEVMKLIFGKQDSDLLEQLCVLKVNAVNDCCQEVLKKLFADGVEVCEKTKNWIAEWMKERKYRITGTTCYELYTYTNTPKEPSGRRKKCHKFLSPKNFKSEAMEYGITNENPARELFKTEHPEFEVVETGLIIGQTLPIFAFSPDGIILKDGKIFSLLEIKCLFDGKTKGIEETVKLHIGKCLEMKKVDNESSIQLKENHKYYGQVQMGMALLNVNTAHFVLYSSFEKKLHVIVVQKDSPFQFKMLSKLKKLHSFVILPEICSIKSGNNNIHREGKHFEYNDVEPKNKLSKNKKEIVSKEKSAKKILKNAMSKKPKVIRH